MSEGCGTSDAGDERSVLRGSLGVVRSRQRFSGIGGGGVDPAAETDGGRGVEAEEVGGASDDGGGVGEAAAAALPAAAAAAAAAAA